jgi:hypothetical protein
MVVISGIKKDDFDRYSLSMALVATAREALVEAGGLSFI